MEDVKLVMLDMDGTLCDEKGQVPLDFPELVHLLREKGIRIGVASGRNGQFASAIFGDLMKEMTCVCNNGAILFDCGEVVFEVRMEEAAVKDILDRAALTEGLFVLLYHRDYIATNLKLPRLEEFFEKMDCRMCYTENLYAEIKGTCSIVIIYQGDDPSVLEAFFRNTDRYDAVYSMDGSADIMPKGISKKSGIEFFAGKYDLAPEQIMVIGNESNDLEMLAYAGVSVAMKNAIPDVKALARYITPEDNAHDGCIRFLRSFFDIPEKRGRGWDKLN